MNKLFGLFLLALACLAPGTADAASCFWVGGSATWDTTNTGGGGAGGIKWASATGGASPCAGGGTGGSPSSGDDVTFDGSSGGGTVTVNFGGPITIIALTAGSYTGTLDFATNNNSITLTGTGGVNVSGAGTKTLNMGSGTWTLSNNQAFWNCSTCANLTLNAGTSTLAFTATGGTTARRFTAGGKTFATVTVASSTSPFQINNSATIGTLTIAPGNTIQPGTNSVVTVTTLSNIAGSSSLQTLFAATDAIASFSSFVITNNWTCDWCGFSATAFSGAGSKTATNSLDFKGNSGITITAPSAGGGGGGRIIGG